MDSAKGGSGSSAGCGSGPRGGGGGEITLNIQTTTGGNFYICVEEGASVDHLKKAVSKKLKVSKDRICLLHRERQLRDGTLKDNGLVEGSRVILLPSVETGLLTQRPENSVMQALESLNDSQVNDFLSGKSPLNLTMRLGDHMMLIQLQLSTLNPGSSGSSTASSTKSRSNSSITRGRNLSTSISASKDLRTSKDLLSKPSSSVSSANERQSTSTENTSQPAESFKQPLSQADDLKPFLRKQDIETLQNAFEIFKSLAEMQEGDPQASDTVKTLLENKSQLNESAKVTACCNEQSPIKSLSNLVSSPLKSQTLATSVVDSNSGSLTCIPSPSSLHSSLIENLIEKCDQPAEILMDTSSSELAPITTPQYVPLPSSLKNNLIESLIGETNDREGDAMCTDSEITDPIAANLTSCLCSTFNPDYPCTTNCHPLVSLTTSSDCDSSTSSFPVEPDIQPSTSSQSFNDHHIHLPSNSKSDEYQKQHIDVTATRNKDLNKNKRLHYLLHRTSKLVNPTAQNKQKLFMQSIVNKHLKKKSLQLTSENQQDKSNSLSPNPTTSSLSRNLKNSDSELVNCSDTSKPTEEVSASQNPRVMAINRTRELETAVSNTVSDTKALIEASKNLTQTLKKLSKEVLTNKVDLADEDSARAKIGQGAVIESMKHHGKGIYSGTFSGTLNPALQDRFGRPKRDISTIIHILNDLLCATPPQYRRGARITFEPTHNTSSTKNKQRENKPEQDGACSEEQTGRGECECSKCSGSTCPYGECNGHPPHPNPEKSCTCRESCQCGKSSTSAEHSVSRKKCMACSDSEVDESKRNSNKNCKKCNLASALALENSKTKCKLDQLRLVMQQKKQKREERKLKAAPYVANSTSVTPLQTESTNVLAEEIDTVA